MTGSPRRLIAPWSTLAIGESLSASSTLPVNMSAHVEALTKGDEDFPKWVPQDDGAILSSIKSSIVSVSGTRNKASAKHIKATPSSVDSPYSLKKTSISPG